VIGVQHPDTLSSMNSLAFTWKGHGRDAEVQPQEYILGVNHLKFLPISNDIVAGWEVESADIGLVPQAAGVWLLVAR
jgi:hypothetical protein